jgi:hypothetical protein
LSGEEEGASRTPRKDQVGSRDGGSAEVEQIRTRVEAAGVRNHKNWMTTAQIL